MSLRIIKNVIRLKWQAQLSLEQIASTLGISKGAVAKYVSLTSVAGLDWETVQDWSEQRLSTALQPRAAPSQPFVEPDWSRMHRELGSFKRAERGERSGRNPQTGEAITIAAATTVKFVPGAALKAGVNNPK